MPTFLISKSESFVINAEIIKKAAEEKWKTDDLKFSEYQLQDLKDYNILKS